MSNFYANITLGGVNPQDVIAYLREAGDIAYVSPEVKEALVVFHENMSAQEDLAARLSAKFHCPALLVMVYGQTVLLYNLYENGEQTDAYVSSPHGDLELSGEAPPGNADVLCKAFAAESASRRVQSILVRETKPGQPYEYAANRHGELFAALGLPLFAAGTGFVGIEIGEVPAGKGFDLAALVRTK